MADTSTDMILTPRSEKSINSRGMSIKHAAKIGEYNKTNSWLTVFRPINPGVTKKLGEEGYKGKVIFIKSKSSEFPPIAGDIPFEAELSKSFNKGKDTIEHFNQVAKGALKRKDEELRSFIERNRDDFLANIEQLEQTESIIAPLTPLPTEKSQDFRAEEELSVLKTKLEELKQKISLYKSKVEEYNLNFFLDKKLKKVKITELNGEFELYYKKLDPTVNGHNVEVGSIGKDEKDNDIFRPVFYAKNTDKCYKLLYNDNGTIKKQEGVKQQHVSDNLKPVEIFTYSQYSLDTGEPEQPPLTADYDQLTAGSVYMTINTNQTYEKKKKLWDAINDITSLQNSEFNQKNLEQIKSHLKNIQIFLPIIERGKKDNYNCIRNVDSLTIEQIKPNEIKEQLEYLKDGFLIPAKNINPNTIDLDFCKSERKKLITYPADKYIKELRENIENILNIKDTQEFKENLKDNLAKIGEFLPNEFKKKYLPSGDITTLGLDSIDIEEIKTQLRIIKKLGLLGTCSEAITREKMAIGKILKYAISHGLEIQHFPPEDIKPRGEEFLVIDEMGKVRVIDGLEGLLSHINYKKSRGIACLEVNPLWPIKKLDNGDIVYSKEEQTPIAEIYDALVGLQLQQNTKKDKTSTEEQENKFDPLGYYIYMLKDYTTMVILSHVCMN